MYEYLENISIYLFDNRVYITRDQNIFYIIDIEDSILYIHKDIIEEVLYDTNKFLLKLNLEFDIFPCDDVFTEEMKDRSIPLFTHRNIIDISFPYGEVMFSTNGFLENHLAYYINVDIWLHFSGSDSDFISYLRNIGANI